MKPEAFIGQKVYIKIDRPLGSIHPQHGHLWFLCNYGYLPGVLGSDGDNLDAYLLGVFTPVMEYSGTCIAVIKRRDDDDDKLVIAPEGTDYTDDQILALTQFIERFHDSYVVRSQPDKLSAGNSPAPKTLDKVNIRQFSIEDYDHVIELWQVANLPIRAIGRDSREKIAEQIQNRTSVFLVAEFDGEIVGTVLGTHDGRKGWINRLAVVSQYRRQRIASRLVSELEDRFGKLGLEVIACLIEPENQISMEFFKKLGYTEWDGKYFSKRKHAGS